MTNDLIAYYRVSTKRQEKSGLGLEGLGPGLGPFKVAY